MIYVCATHFITQMPIIFNGYLNIYFNQRYFIQFNIRFKSSGKNFKEILHFVYLCFIIHTTSLKKFIEVIRFGILF